MKQSIYTIKSNLALTENVFELRLLGNTTAFTAPGQFVNIRLEGFYLRRPISVCGIEPDTITLIYKTVGAGTEKLSRMCPGEKLDLLTGLGNGFDTAKSGSSPLLIGGGVGVPPMFQLCRELVSQGKKVSVIMGFNTKSEVFYEQQFKDLGACVTVTIVDGSYGTKGFVTAAMSQTNYSYFYACGPEPMLKAVYNESKTSGQLSFEERMGCGFGACMGCSCKTKYGNKRICKDGPVLEKEEIIW